MENRCKPFTSRWTVWCAWQYARADAVCEKKRHASHSLSRPCAMMRSMTSPPDAYSITRKRLASDSMTSYRRMMFGWCSIFMMATSRWTMRSVSSFSRALSMILMATRVPNGRCVASFTLPNWPSPIVFSSR